MAAGRARPHRLSLHRQAPEARPAACPRRSRSSAASPTTAAMASTPYVLRDGQNRTLPVDLAPARYLPLRNLHPRPQGRAARRHSRQVRPRRHGRGRVIIQLAGGLDAGGQPARLPGGIAALRRPRPAQGRPAHPKPTLIYAPGPREALEGVELVEERAARLDARQCPRADLCCSRRQRTASWTHTGDRPAGQFDRRSSRASDSRRPGADRRHQLPDAALAVARRCRRRARRTEIMAQPAKFDASNLVVEQLEATSSDGTKIPYFIVHRRDIKLDGNNPTLLYAYGGFQVSRDADLFGDQRQAVARARRRLCARQHPRRRRVRAGVARGRARRPSGRSSTTISPRSRRT